MKKMVKILFFTVVLLVSSFSVKAAYQFHFNMEACNNGCHTAFEFCQAYADDDNLEGQLRCMSAWRACLNRCMQVNMQ